MKQKLKAHEESQCHQKKNPAFLKQKQNLLLIIVGALLSFLMLHTLWLHFDSTQILDKSYKLIFLDEWTHYGNRATKVGYLPGSLLTAVTALPMMLYLSPYSSGFIILLFHFFALLMLLDIGRKFPSKDQQLLLYLILIMFWLNPWRIEQFNLYNPAFLFLFSSLHLWTSLKMMKSHFFITVLHICSIGFCFQFHYSALILAITSLILLYYKKIKFHLWGLAVGLTLCLASLIPWLLLLATNKNINLINESEFFFRSKLPVYSPHH